MGQPRRSLLAAPVGTACTGFACVRPGIWIRNRNRTQLWVSWRALTAGHRGPPHPLRCPGPAVAIAAAAAAAGGVLLDSLGRVIGINTAIADPSGRGSNSGIGFAMWVRLQLEAGRCGELINSYACMQC